MTSIRIELLKSENVANDIEVIQALAEANGIKEFDDLSLPAFTMVNNDTGEIIRRESVGKHCIWLEGTEEQIAGFIKDFNNRFCID